jgi:RimJ/RimL family protein N-acetyltransferase
MAAFPAPDPPLTDGTLTLRPLASEDAPAFWRGTQLADVDSAWNNKLADEEATRAYIDELPERMASGRTIVLAITDGREFLGIVMMFLADWQQASVELGFWLTREARGRGAAVAAVRLMSDWAFRELGFGRIWALTHVDNDPAGAALERAGFVREGVLRGFEKTADGRLDLMSYARLASDQAA